jgi:hypothetical protein
MNKWLMRAALAGGLLAQAGVAVGQSAVVDLKDFRPREIKSVVFSLPSAQDLRVEAVGAESDNNRGTFSWVTTMWNGRNDGRRDPWMGNAWILDLTSRRVVWELSSATTERGRRSTRAFAGTVRLPAGTYEAFYAPFPNMFWTDDNGDTNAAQRFVNWLADEGFDEFKLTIRGSAQALAGTEAERARHAFESGAVVTLRGNGGQKFLQTGFILSRPTQVDIYAEGEAREDSEFDSGWIINADTHEKVWKLTWRDSAAAGGAEKNRMARISKTLPAGRYAAFYATDDSHDPSQWNSAPPHDPQAWGLLIRVLEAEAGGAGASVKSSAYEHVPANATIVALTKVGDGESRSRGFTLTRAMDVRIYALGEGRQDRMFDYGWIVNSATHQKVWEMRYADTESAGGDAKNRAFDRAIRLEKGDYVVHYVSDDSHSFDDWNAAAPSDGQHWGITLLAAQGPLERSAVSEYSEKTDPSLVAQLVRLRDDENARKLFRLDRETQVRIYALGEGGGRSLADYGWIEDAKTGKTVWEMTYRTTEPAGGASKNRRFDGTITLPAGDYVLRYETDGSHAFGSWNANPPDDPDMWGITIYRVK